MAAFRSRLNIVAVSIMIGFWSSSARSADIFSDDFESGDRAKTENGFSWSNSGDNVFVSTDVALSGKYSLCFRFAGKPPGADAMAEQRFKLGGNYTELWVQFNVFLPKNYFHRAENPGNNKLMSLWSRDYQNTGNLTVLHLWPEADGGSAVTYMVSDKKNRPLIKDGGHPMLFELDKQRGKWTEVTYHWRRQTSETSSDGLVEMWRKVGSGPREKIISAENLDNTWGRDGGPSPAYNFVTEGYLLGWANSGFSEDTQICIDDVKFSTQPVIPLVEPKSPNSISVR